MKKCSINAVPTFAYKFVAGELSPILAKLCHESITLGIFLDCFKTARITPTYKTDNKKYVENYRPIFSSLFLSKVFNMFFVTCFINRSYSGSFEAFRRYAK